MVTEKKVLTVTQLTEDIKTILECAFESLAVQGEISNLRRPSSGHIYFTLKDDAAQLKCVFFRNANVGLKCPLQDGLQVICFGRVSVYEREGAYQLYVNSVEPKGIGALQLAFEQLKKKLEQEGLFDVGRKKPLPALPQRVGVVTSPTGAAIMDMINILRRRAPFVSIVIRPVRVQGEGAAEEIAQAIAEFNEYGKVDALIVGRGGGSLEDLWAFNEEVVARAIFRSKIPIISAVGHQTDFTIADFVADVRAATPSEAAEIVARKKEDLLLQIEGLVSQLRDYCLSSIEQYSQALDEHADALRISISHALTLNRERAKGLAGRLALLNPAVWIQKEMKLLGQLQLRLQQRMGYSLSFTKQKFHSFVNKLEALSPLKVLGRGYSISFHTGTGKVLADIEHITVGDEVRTVLSRGRFTSVVREVERP
jgi:exodeoxyribonuclease VII large subunit